MLLLSLPSLFHYLRACLTEIGRDSNLVIREETKRDFVVPVFLHSARTLALGMTALSSIWRMCVPRAGARQIGGPRWELCRDRLARDPRQEAAVGKRNRAEGIQVI